MSSAYDGFGIAPAEAKAMGVPVVATDVSGVREVVRHGHTGFLVPFNDAVVAAMASSVEALIRQPDLRKELGAKARIHVEENLSVRRMQSELECIYRKVLDGYSGEGMA